MLHKKWKYWTDTYCCCIDLLSSNALEVFPQLFIITSFWRRLRSLVGVHNCTKKLMGHQKVSYLFIFCLNPPWKSRLLYLALMAPYSLHVTTFVFVQLPFWIIILYCKFVFCLKAYAQQVCNNDTIITYF